MAWFDLNSLQQQISQSLGEASELINTVNRLEILNLDEMAVQQEEEEKQLEEEYDEEEEDEEEGIINHDKSDDNTPFNKPIFTPISSSTIKNELPNSARINLFDHEENYDKEAQSLMPEKDENKEQEELARKIQEQLADEWNDSFLNDKPQSSQPIADQDLPVEDTKSMHSSIADSALTTLEEVKSTSETIPHLPNNTEISANSPLPPITSKPKRPSIFGKLNPKETSSNSSNSPIPPVIEPANLAALAADLLPPSVLENQDNLTSKKKKQKQGSKTSKKKKPKQKKKSLDFFGTSSFLKNQEDDEEQEALTTTNTTNDKPGDTSDNPNAVGGFGLTALWDDGSAAVDDYVTNDDFHIPLPPPSSSMHSHHDIEAANGSSSNHDDGNSNTSIFNNFFGTTSSTTATSSALNTIQLSNEFLSNLSKKAVTSFFDNIETEIDLEEDPILKQVEWNKRNPHAIRSLQDQQNNSFGLNFFPTTSNTSTNNTMIIPSSSSSSSSFPSSTTQMMDQQTSSSTSLTSPSITSQYSSLLKEAVSSFSRVFIEMKEIILPFSSLNIGKVLQILWKIIQLALLLLYYSSMMLLFIPLQGIAVVICGPRLLQSFSFSQEQLQSMRVRIRNRLREYCNANNILMGLTGILFIVSYWKFQRYGTDAGD